MQEAATKESSLLEKLGKPGHYTIFAPTNKAFEKVDNVVLDQILNDKTVLQGKYLAQLQKKRLLCLVVTINDYKRIV